MHINQFKETRLVCVSYSFPRLYSVMRSYLVDGELSLKATTIALVERNLHGVVYVTDLVAAHLILDVQTHH